MRLLVILKGPFRVGRSVFETYLDHQTQTIKSLRIIQLCCSLIAFESLQLVTLTATHPRVQEVSALCESLSVA